MVHFFIRKNTFTPTIYGTVRLSLDDNIKHWFEIHVIGPYDISTYFHFAAFNVNFSIFEALFYFHSETN